jgi:hypothetical protein
LNNYKDGWNYLLKAKELKDTSAYLFYAGLYYEEKITFEEAKNSLLEAISLGEDEAKFELGKLYAEKEYYDEELALRYLKEAKEAGFDCDYEINLLTKNFDDKFLENLQKFTKTNKVNKNSALKFCTKYIGLEFNHIVDKTKHFIVRSVYEYMRECKDGWEENDFSPALIYLAKALENELDSHLGKDLYNYLKNFESEDVKKEQIMKSSNNRRTLGEYQFEYSKKKDNRLIDDIHLSFLKSKFKDGIFGNVNEDTNITNYITNFVKEIKKFSEKRNAAAHKGIVSQETCEKWLDKMIGSGHMLFNFLTKLK